MAKPATAAPPSSARGARQKVLIRIGYQGKGPPGPQLAERCDVLAKMLVEADAGTIHEHKAGGGAVDIQVVTRFADHTIETGWKIVKELGLTDRATINVEPGKAVG